MLEVCKRVSLAATLLVVLLLAVGARAQLQIGENTSVNLNGNLSFGYTGDYSNVAGSSHGMNPGGNADLSGFYYSPGFLSFDVQPFFDQSRTNSTVQSVFQSSGVNSSVSLFSGSHFPGTVNYAKTYNSEGGFSVPGVGNFTTRGNSDNLALNWGIRIPDYPSISFLFTDGSNSSSVFGTNAPSSFHGKMFGVTASDRWAGFTFNGGYHRNSVHSLTPEFLAGEGPMTTDTLSNTFDFSLGHKLPFRGAFSAAASKSDINSDSGTDKFNGSIDTVSSGVNFEPVRNLNVGVNAQYTNNLEGTLYQSFITTGGILPTGLLTYSTHSLDINSQANYALPKLHLNFVASADHREQTLLDNSLSANSYDEMGTYSNDLLGGFINATAGVTQTELSAANSSSSLGLFGNLSYTRKVGNWSFSGGGNYSRNTQTVLIGVTSSGHGYSAGIGRKFAAYSYWSFNFVGTKLNFNDVAGSGTFAQSYSTSISLKRFSLSASYGKSDGTSFLTPTGLAPVTNPVPLPLQSILFGGKSFSFGASTTPIRGLVLSGSYSSTKSNTAADSVMSNNSTAQLNTMLQYKVRKLWITGGYLKLQQGFSISGQPAASYSSFFVGITRWFKFF